MWIRCRYQKELCSFNMDRFDLLNIRNDIVERSIELDGVDARYTIYTDTDRKRVEIVYDVIWKNMAFGATTFDLVHFLDTIDWSSYGVMAETDTQDMPF